jgi:hypothetical protein
LRERNNENGRHAELTSFYFSNQMKNNVSQILKKDGSKGTGFFCKIPLSEKTNLAAFITNNHVIDEEFLME